METTTTPTPTSSHLEYAPPLPWRRRPGTRRLMFASLVVAVLIFVALLTPALWHRVELMRWQRECLSYRATDDQPIFEIRDLPPAPTPAGTATGSIETITTAPPQAWAEYYRLHGGGLGSWGTAFLHARTSPGGTARLVAIDLGTDDGWSPTFFARLFSVGSFMRPGVELPSHLERSVTLLPGPGALPVPLRVFPGQPDPSDPSHFTIEYERIGVRHTLDGWLRDDDTVVIESRN